ncbi:MAG: ABC transporter permease [Azonexus sp.]|nr:ABC transporter permease [Azonexus sp.]
MFLSLFAAPLRHRALLRQFMRREVLGRYRGSLLGLGWAFVLPLAMLAVYTFVFAGVFRLRWPGAEEAGGVVFALRLFAGLIVFQLVAEVLGRAPTLVTAQPNLVKKVVFPLELLPFVSLGVALFHFAVSVALLLVAVLLVEQHLPVTALLAPLAILPLLPLLLGLGFLLAALGVFVRDIATIIGVGVNLLLFLSPVFYSVESLAPRWQFWMRLNPLTPAIEDLRRTLFAGLPPLWADWWLALGGGLIAAAGGAWVFAKTRRGFADVL